MKVVNALTMLASLAASMPALAQDLTPPFESSIVRLEGGYWRPGFDTQLQVGQLGTLVDAKADLGINDRGRLGGALTLRLGDRHRIRATVAPLDYTGSKLLERTVVFDGRTYSVSSQIASSVKGGYYTGAYQFGLVRSRGVEIDGSLGAKFFDVEAVVSAVDEGRRSTTTLRAPIPVVGAVGRFYGPRVGLTAAFDGLTIGKRGSLYELDVRGRVFVSRNLTAHVGFRKLSVRAEEDPDFGRFRLSGGYLGAEVGF